MRLLNGIALAVSMAAAGTASAQLRPSPLGDIYESYNDCFKVAVEGGVKPDVLPALGWSRATVSSKNGKVEKGTPIIYSHLKRAPLILLSSEQGDGICIVMARLENTKAFKQFKSAWGGKLPKPDAQGAITFFAEGHPIQLRQTGTTDKPSLSIVVGIPAKSQ